MARSRISLVECVGLAGLMAGAPLAAQSTTNAVTPPATVPTPSPAPTGNAVGPPQLRDFTINGTVTQPAAPAPAPGTPSSSTPPAPATAVPRQPAPATAAPRASVAAPRQPAAPVIEQDLAPQIDPTSVPAPIAVEPGFAPSLAPAPDSGRSASPEPEPAFGWWPWLAALLVVALAGLLWWRRQSHGEQRYAADHADVSALAEASPLPAPPPRPRTLPPKAPAPAPPTPLPDGIVSSRVTAQVPDGIVSSRLAAEAPVGIVASGLKPQIEFELVPISAEADAGQGAALTVDIIVINRGSAPARDVLIKAKLINAGPHVDEEIGQFFMLEGGEGERLEMIQPMARIVLRTRIAAPKDSLAPLVIGGRSLFVPMVALNAYYRGGGRDLKDSASFLVGRGTTDGGKMAPLRLDLGPRRWSDLSSRVHSAGLAT